MMSIEALVSLLTRKGLITEQEILDELKAIKARDEQEKNWMKRLWLILFVIFSLNPSVFGQDVVK